MDCAISFSVRHSTDDLFLSNASGCYHYILFTWLVPSRYQRNSDNSIIIMDSIQPIIHAIPANPANCFNCQLSFQLKLSSTAETCIALSP